MRVHPCAASAATRKRKMTSEAVRLRCSRNTAFDIGPPVSSTALAQSDPPQALPSSQRRPGPYHLALEETTRLTASMQRDPLVLFIKRNEDLSAMVFLQSWGLGDPEQFFSHSAAFESVERHRLKLTTWRRDRTTR